MLAYCFKSLMQFFRQSYTFFSYSGCSFKSNDTCSANDTLNLYNMWFGNRESCECNLPKVTGKGRSGGGGGGGVDPRPTD